MKIGKSIRPTPASYANCNTAVMPDRCSLRPMARERGCPRVLPRPIPALPGRFATDVAANHAVPGRAKSNAPCAHVALARAANSVLGCSLGAGNGAAHGAARRRIPARRGGRRPRRRRHRSRRHHGKRSHRRRASAADPIRLASPAASGGWPTGSATRRSRRATGCGGFWLDNSLTLYCHDPRLAQLPGQFNYLY
jgi:hypothetical protein